MTSSSFETDGWNWVNDALKKYESHRLIVEELKKCFDGFHEGIYNSEQVNRTLSSMSYGVFRDQYLLFNNHYEMKDVEYVYGCS